MRLILVSLALALSLSLYAQTAGGDRPAPKNLQVLPSSVDLLATMTSFREGLGVNCYHCHIQGNFASDENPKKSVARTMIKIVRSVNSMLPEGFTQLTCFTCHRGEVKPQSQP